MALEDFMEPEVGIAVALTAAVASPGVRKVLRKGAVYGLAGILMAGDAVSSLAQGVKRGAAQAAPAGGPEPVPEEAAVTAPEIITSAETLPAETPIFAAASEEAAAPETHAAPKRVRRTAEAVVNE